MAATDVIQEVTALARSFIGRDDFMKEMYKTLQTTDPHEDEDIESFVSNDPRTLWNMATFLLIPKPPQFTLKRKDGLVFDRNLHPQAQRIQEFFTQEWARQDKKKRMGGKQGFFRSFLGMFLATGWYFVPHEMGDDGTMKVDFWNPLNVFPVWGEDGLDTLARKQQIRLSVARQRAQDNNWELPKGQFGTQFIDEFHLFKQIDPNRFSHTVVMGTDWVKPWEMHPGKIPVLAGVAGGLPDNGNLDDSFPRNQGQSVLATNEKVYLNQNRQHSFLQQMVHDTANPRWFEQSTGEPILRPADMFKRGAIFRGGVNDTVQALQVPPIPVEARSSLFDLENMIQRGGVSNLTFGNVQQAVSSVLMSQAAESTMQLIGSYQESTAFVMSVVTDGWWQSMVANPKARPKWMSEFDDEIFKDTEIEGFYSVRIPGDFQARALTAKVLNPDFILPLDMVYDQLMPEITNKAKARADLRADRALLDPSFNLVTVIRAHQAKASEATNLGLRDLAQLHLFAAEAGKQVLTQGTGSPPPQPQPPGPANLPPSLAPGQMNQDLQGAANG
jgi:hypothetical protein